MKIVAIVEVLSCLQGNKAGTSGQHQSSQPSPVGHNELPSIKAFGSWSRGRREGRGGWEECRAMHDFSFGFRVVRTEPEVRCWSSAWLDALAGARGSSPSTPAVSGVTGHAPDLCSTNGHMLRM